MKFVFEEAKTNKGILNKEPKSLLAKRRNDNTRLPGTKKEGIQEVQSKVCSQLFLLGRLQGETGIRAKDI